MYICLYICIHIYIYMYTYIYMNIYITEDLIKGRDEARNATAFFQRLYKDGKGIYTCICRHICIYI
jgi:hypothetical protein